MVEAQLYSSSNNNFSLENILITGVQGTLPLTEISIPYPDATEMVGFLSTYYLYVGTYLLKPCVILLRVKCISEFFIQH